MFLALLIAGCGKEEPKEVMRGAKVPSVAVENVVPVRSGSEDGPLLIPASALFRNGALAGVLVVGADQRLTLPLDQNRAECERRCGCSWRIG